MDGLDATPLAVQVLQDQASVAMLRPSLAAQQYRRYLEEIPVQSLLHPALPQEFEKRPLVVRPSPVVPLGVEELAGRDEQGFVEVLGAAQLLQEER